MSSRALTGDQEHAEQDGDWDGGRSMIVAVAAGTAGLAVQTEVYMAKRVLAVRTRQDWSV